MYEQYWGLSESPFRNGLDVKWFHATPGHEEALARLFYLVEHGRRCGVVVGRAGVGKSLLLRVLSGEARRTQRVVASIDLAGQSAIEVIDAIAAALPVAGDGSGSRGDWRALEDQFIALRLSHVPAVLLLDRLERAEPETLVVVDRLLGLALRSCGWVTIVAATRRSGLPQCPRGILDAADLRIDVPAWTAAEIAGYVRNALHRAGCRRPVFEPSAFVALHEETQGLPRRIIRLCNLALVAAMGEERESVGDETIRRVAAELDLTHAAPPPRRQAVASTDPRD